MMGDLKIDVVIDSDGVVVEVYPNGRMGAFVPKFSAVKEMDITSGALGKAVVIPGHRLLECSPEDALRYAESVVAMAKIARVLDALIARRNDLVAWPGMGTVIERIALNLWNREAQE